MMFVNIAVLKETQAHERRVALVPAIAPRLIALGARLHMQSGAGVAAGIPDAAYRDVAFADDRQSLARNADVVLCVQPPPLDVIAEMHEGAIVVSFIYADHHEALVDAMLARKITCFAMERIPRISRAQAMDALSSQSALAGYYAVQLGTTTMNRVLPKMTTAGGTLGPAKVLVMGGLVLPGSRPLPRHIAWVPPWRVTMFAPTRRSRRSRSAQRSSIPGSMHAEKAATRVSSRPLKSAPWMRRLPSTFKPQI